MYRFNNEISYKENWEKFNIVIWFGIKKIIKNNQLLDSIGEQECRKGEGETILGSSKEN